LATQAASAFELVVAVVLAGDQQGGDLQPAVGFVVDHGQDVEHRLQLRAAELDVEVVGEGLEVDVGGVHLRIELARRVRGACSRP
jgi:hypothetical protein